MDTTTGLLVTLVIILLILLASLACIYEHTYLRALQLRNLQQQGLLPSPALSYVSIPALAPSLPSVDEEKQDTLMVPPPKLRRRRSAPPILLVTPAARPTSHRRGSVHSYSPSAALPTLTEQPSARGDMDLPGTPTLLA